MTYPACESADQLLDRMRKNYHNPADDPDQTGLQSTTYFHYTCRDCGLTGIFRQSSDPIMYCEAIYTRCPVGLARAAKAEIEQGKHSEAIDLLDKLIKIRFDNW